MGISSARPERLQRFGDTTDAVRAGLRRRTAQLREDWQVYRASHGSEWRFEFGDLPGAIEAWADTLARIGSFTADVGRAFERADRDGVLKDSDDGVLSVIDTRLRARLPHRWKELLDTRAGPISYLDWGDPDDPPAWLEAAREGGLVFEVGAGGVRGLERSYVQPVSGYVRADGTVVRAYQRYRPGTGGRALLGRFASASSLRTFERWLGRSATAFAGLAAGLNQWAQDSGTLNYTDEEQLGRAVARGSGTAVGGGLGALGGGAVTSVLCGPGAPVCAGVVIIGGGLVGTGVGNWLVDLFMDDPEPGEHDPDLVRTHVESGGGHHSEAIEAEAAKLGFEAAKAEFEQTDAMLQALVQLDELLGRVAADAVDLPPRLPEVDYDWMADWLELPPQAGFNQWPPSLSPDQREILREHQESRLEDE